jgi:Tol biopolymer transport system component
MNGTSVVRTLALATVCVWAALAVAVGGCSSGGPSPAVTVTVTTSPTSTHGVTAPPTTKPAVKKQLAIAAVSGPMANGISVVGSAGQVRQLVAPSGGPILNLQWSRDGAKLAFIHFKSSNSSLSSLWVYDVSTEKKLLISSTTAGYTWVGPTQLVAAPLKKGAAYRVNGYLTIIDLSGTGTSNVKDGTGHKVMGAYPSASADGRRIVFVHYGTASGGEIPEQLRLYSTDSRSVTTIAKGSAPADLDGDSFAYPQISPDGSLVYAAHTGGDPGFSCTVYRTDGSKAFNSGELGWPAPCSWQSDGRLAFGGGATMPTLSDAVNVWLPGTPKATTIVNYPNGKGTISSLAWTPLGKQIVYAWHAANNAVNGDLWIVGVDGSNKHLLLHNGSWPACALAPVTFP